MASVSIRYGYAPKEYSNAYTRSEGNSLGIRMTHFQSIILGDLWRGVSIFNFTIEGSRTYTQILNKKAHLSIMIGGRRKWCVLTSRFSTNVG